MEFSTGKSKYQPSFGDTAEDPVLPDDTAAPATPRKFSTAKVKYQPTFPEPEEAGFWGAAGSSFSSGADAMHGVVDMARIELLPPEQRVAAMLELANRPAPADEPDMIQATDVRGFGDAWRLVRESLGQTAGSWAAAATIGGGAGALTGAAIGGAAGAAAGPAAIPGAIGGAATGFTTGTAAGFGGMGVGGMYMDLLRDKGVQKALKDGTLDPQMLSQIAFVSGSAIGALDALPAGRAFERFASPVGKKLVKRMLINGLKSSIEEGTTEAFQQTIGEVTEALTGGDVNAKERALNILNAGVSGAIGGAGAGGVSGVRSPKENNNTGDTTGADDGQADDQQGHTTTNTPVGNEPGKGPGGLGEEAQPPATTKTGTLDGTNTAAPAQPSQTGTPSSGDAVVTTGTTIDPAITTVLQGKGAEPGTPNPSGPMGATTPSSVIPDEEYEDEEGGTAVRDIVRQMEETQAAAEAAKSAVVGKPGADIEVALNEQTKPKARRGRPPKVPLTPVETPVIDAPVVPETTAEEVTPVETPPAPVEEVAAQPEPAVLPEEEVDPNFPEEEAPVEPETVPEIPVTQDEAIPEDIDFGEEAATPEDYQPSGVVDTEKPVFSTGQSTYQPDFGTPTGTAAGAQEATEAITLQPTAETAPAAVPEGRGKRKAREVKEKQAQPPATPPAPKPTLTTTAPVSVPARVQTQQVGTAAGAVVETVGKGKRKAKEIQAKKQKAATIRKEQQAAEVRPIEPGQTLIKKPAGPHVTTAGPLGRSMTTALSERMKEELKGQHVDEPGFQDVLDAIAANRLHAVPQGTSPKQAVEDQVQGGVAEVMRYYKERQAEKQEAEAAEKAKTEEAIDLNRSLNRKAQLEGKPQERERAGKKKGKSAEALAQQTRWALRREINRELAKPEDQRDPHVMRIHDLVEKRRKAGKNMKFIWTNLIQAVRNERLAEQEKKDTEKRAAESKRLAERVEKERQREAAQKKLEEAEAAEKTARETADEKASKEDRERQWKEIQDRKAAAEAEVKAAEAEKRRLENEEKAARQANAEERATRSREALAEPLPDMRRVSSMADVKDITRKYFQKAVSSMGKLLGKGISKYNTPEENLLIKAREMLAANSNNLDWLVYAKLELDANGATQDFLDAIDADSPGSAKEAGLTAVPSKEAEAEPLATGRQRPPQPTTTSFNGKTVTPTRSTNGAALLRETVGENQRQGFRDALHRMWSKMQAKQLRKLVGDIPVHFLSDAEYNALSGNDGSKAFFTNYKDGAVNKGAVQKIFINEALYNTSGPREQMRIATHEMTHAATAYALNHNLHGTRTVINAMLKELRKQLGEQAATNINGLSNAHEFVTDAFTSPSFQELLSKLELPLKLRIQLAAVTRGKAKPTWWDAVLNAVGNALNLTRVPFSDTYLNGVMALHPLLMQSTREQMDDLSRRNAIARGKADRLAKLRRERAVGQAGAEAASPVSPGVAAQFSPGAPQPRGPLDARNMMRDTEQLMEEAVATVSQGVTPWAGKKLRKLESTEALNRRATGLFGGENNMVNRLIDRFLGNTGLRNRLAKQSDDLAREQDAYKRADPAEYKKMTAAVFDATQSEVDPTDLDDNRHLNNGITHFWKRTRLAQLRNTYNSLSQRGKDLWKRTIQYHKDMQDKRVAYLTKNILDSAVGKYNVQLPAGETIGEYDDPPGKHTVLEWVLSGDIDRIGQFRTPRDQALHDALGSTAKTLQEGKALRRIKGNYVPLLRFGSYYVAARHKVAVPAGATVDPEAKGNNILVFQNENDLKSFLSSTDEHVQHVRIRWVDQNGKTVTADDLKAAQQNPSQLALPQKRYVATVQNQTMIMDDRRLAVYRAERRLRKLGYDIEHNTRMLDKEMSGVDAILPAAATKIINSLEQTMGDKGSLAKTAAAAAVRDLYIRQMAGQRAAQRRLRRSNVLGFEDDLVKTTLTSGRTMAGHLTNLRNMPELTRLDAEAQKYVHDISDDHTSARQNVLAEVRERIQKSQTRNNEGTGAGVIRSILGITYMAKLMRPSYLIHNGIQMASTTMPLLTARYGYARSAIEMGKTLQAIGFADLYGRGAKDLVRGYRKIVAAQPYLPDETHSDYLKRTMNEPDQALINQALDMMEEFGFGTGAGAELEAASALGREGALGRFTNGLNRITGPFRAMSEGIEAVNRAGTLITTLRLEKQKGATDAQAIRRAVSTVEETQGGYAAENNPNWVSYKPLMPAVQFKKYSLMYAGAYYRALAGSFAGATPEMRSQARYELANMTVATMVLAGAYGLPVMEFGMATALLASFLTGDPWEWDDAENWVQEHIKGALSFLFSNDMAGMGAEALTRGFTRLPGIGVDTSNRLGNSATFLYNSPDQYDTMGWSSWMMDMIGGASKGVAFDTRDAILQGKWDKLPLPAFMRDLYKAYDQHENGKVNRYGSQVQDPYSIGDTIRQGLGWTPASSARQWETGGSGVESKHKQREQDKRRLLTTHWSTSEPDSKEREQAMEKIREWNETHTGKDRITRDTLIKSRNRERQAQRERKRKQEAQ